MKKNKIIIFLILIILFLIISIFSIVLYNNRHSKIKVNDFIKTYETYLQQNVDENIHLSLDSNYTFDGIEYWIKITDEIELGLSANNDEKEINIFKNSISTTALRYPININNYEYVDKLLFYLIKTNNSKISNQKIEDMIKDLRTNSNEEIFKNNLILSHYSNEYQIDNVGKY